MTTHDDHTDDSVEDIDGLLRMAGPREMPNPLYRDHARVAVRAAWRDSMQARTRRHWILFGAPALAAAAALILATALWWQAPRRAPAGILARVATTTDSVRVQRGSSLRSFAAGAAIQPGDIVETPANVVAAFTLEDGGEIRQNSDTVLRWTSPRQVSLEQGHIYLDSGGTAIAVTTSGGVVRDIGTRFDVQVRNGEVRVRVRDGAVRIETPTIVRDTRAGREIVVNAAGVIAEHPTAIYGGDWDWIIRASSFRLEGARLAAFLSWIEAESRRRVEFRPASLRAETTAIRLDGSVAGLSIADALNVVLPAAGLTHQMAGDRIIIERPRAQSRP